MSEKTLKEQSGIVRPFIAALVRRLDPFGDQPLDLSNSDIPCGGHTQTVRRDMK